MNSKNQGGKPGMIYWKFLISLLWHKWYVFRAGLMLGGISLWRLIVHDWSKLTPAEFGRYARSFQGDYSGSPNDRNIVATEYLYAWLHHENTNLHHWGHWIPRAGRGADAPLDMPEVHIREMIADCMGASKAYTGSWDMTDWLNQNYHKMKLSGTSRKIADDILCELGY